MAPSATAAPRIARGRESRSSIGCALATTSSSPTPALPLGLGCVYAQVATCAAPCLLRVSEEAYRSLARQAADLLAPGGPRSPEIAALLKPWVATVSGSFALVSERGSNGLELYPVVQGAVFEEGAAVQADAEPPMEALSRLAWPERGAAARRLRLALELAPRLAPCGAIQDLPWRAPAVAELAERLHGPGL